MANTLALKFEIRPCEMVKDDAINDMEAMKSEHEKLKHTLNAAETAIARLQEDNEASK